MQKQIHITIVLILSIIPFNVFAKHYKYRNDYKMERVYKKNDYKMEKLVACENAICEPFRFLATLSGGAAFVKMGESETFTAAGTKYTYDPNSGSQTKKMWGASVGEEFHIAEGWAVDLTIGYYQIATIRANGTATQGSTTYDYQYNVNSKQYLFETKFLADMTIGSHIYGLLGIGAAINRQGNYDISSGSVVDPAMFDSNDDWNFAYSVGIGFDFDVIKYARLGIGYRFVGLGPAQLGSANIGEFTTSNTIGQTTFNAQEVFLQLTLIA